MHSVYLTLSEAAQKHYVYRMLEDLDVMGDVMYAVNHPRTDGGKTGRPRKHPIRICEVCGAPYNGRPTRKVCSSVCAAKWSHQKQREAKTMAARVGAAGTGAGQ